MVSLVVPAATTAAECEGVAVKLVAAATPTSVGAAPAVSTMRTATATDAAHRALVSPRLEPATGTVTRWVRAYRRVTAPSLTTPVLME